MIPADATSPAVEARNVTVRYRDSAALQDASITIPAGSYTCLLGPSGSGKTTLLRAIAGLVAPDSGALLLHGADLTAVAPERRDIGFVFQDYALFPHMTVERNVAYPLRVRGIKRSEQAAVVDTLLERVRLVGKGGRYPSELSGGERQRVAVARALAFRPKMLLLDEPLAALDKNLRVAVQRQLRELQREYGITFVHVTHDQSEAMALSDQIVVMRDGRVEQSGTPEEVYRQPRNTFVSEFLGESNLLRGELVLGPDGPAFRSPLWSGKVPADRIADSVVGGPASLLLRPDDARLNQSDGCTVSGRVADVVFQGGHFEVTVDVGGDALHIRASEPLRPGDVVTVGWAEHHLYIPAVDG